MEPVGSVVSRMNAGLTPRKAACWVCKNVAHAEDVTVRLLDGTTRLPPHDARDYLKSLGHSASPDAWASRLKTHTNHVLASLENGTVITPAHRKADAVIRMTPAGGDPDWLRAPKRAIDLGNEAMQTLSERLDEMEDKDLVSLARLGVTAAGKMGDWAAKGRQLGQVDKLMDLFYQSGNAEEG